MGAVQWLLAQLILHAATQKSVSSALYNVSDTYVNIFNCLIPVLKDAHNKQPNMRTTFAFLGVMVYG